MARLGSAGWRPIPVNYSAGGNQPRLLIVHIMQGTLSGTDSWFRNPAAQASAHFGTGKDGTIYQWVDTKDRAWHASNANGHSIGVENEGYSGQNLTVAQVKAVAEIYAWAHHQHGAISMWLNTNPYSGSGLSWHGLGGDYWGNHPNCPGAPIVRQLPGILEAAKRILNPAPDPEPIQAATIQEASMYLRAGDGRVPYAIPDGIHKLRLVGAPPGAKVKIEWHNGAEQVVTCWWIKGSATVNVPSNVKAALLSVVDGKGVVHVVPA